MIVERPAVLIFVWSGALLFVASLAVFGYSYFVSFGRPAPPGPVGRDVLVNIALFSVFALHHSLLARSGAKGLLQRVLSAPLERSIYTWTASILLIVVCLRWRLIPGELYRVEGSLAIVGHAIQITGAAVSICGSTAIGMLKLAGVQSLLEARQGRAAEHLGLQTSGLYGFVRHPLYFAWVLMMFGTPHMTATRLVFAIVSTAYLALAIPLEERGLIGVFGDEYRSYKRRVRWRMVPGVY